MRTITTRDFVNIRGKCTLNGDKAKMKSGQQNKLTHRLFILFNTYLKAVTFKVISQQTYTVLYIMHVWSTDNYKCLILQFQVSTGISPIIPTNQA